MQTFAQFLHDTAGRGEAVNLMFEQRLFDLAGILHKITGPLMDEGVPHELIGGLAVLVHVEEADPEHTTLTRDVDLMIRRSDLERVTEIAARHGVRLGHLLFSGEKVRPNQATPNPPIQPEKKNLLGADVFIIPVADLVRMKLSAYRDQDRIHIRSMDAAGLITSEVERALPEDLKTRLQHIRETE
jgi:hypothetical protein